MTARLPYAHTRISLLLFYAQWSAMYMRIFISICGLFQASLMTFIQIIHKTLLLTSQERVSVERPLND